MNSSRKGKTFEQFIARQFREAGFPAERFRLSGQGLGEQDLKITIRGGIRVAQCKKRKDGSKLGWPSIRRLMEDADMAVIGEDSKEPLVVMPLAKLLEML